MIVESHVVRLEARMEGEIPDITDKVQKIVENGPIKNGVVFLFVPESLLEKTHMRTRGDSMIVMVILMSELR